MTILGIVSCEVRSSMKSEGEASPDVWAIASKGIAFGLGDSDWPPRTA